MATFYLDPEGGNNGNDGLSFANRWATFAGGPTAARIAPGDTIRIKASPDPTSLGSCSWTNGQATVTLPGAVTAHIDSCDNNWTGAANVTQTTHTTTRREGSGCQQFVIASGFTTGLAAHHDLGGTFDFSAYQQITFWLMASTSIAANALQIKLCSDNAGVTAVDTLTVSYLINAANRWIPITIDKGSALGSNIQSVALYFATDPGSVTVKLDHISAVKSTGSADSLHLTCLIGKNTGASEPWFTIRSIVGTTVTLGWGDSSITTETDTQGVQVYYGTTESVTTYKRELMNYQKLQGGGSTSALDSGTPGSPITFSGGWNRTDMSTQTGETWMFNSTQIFNFAGFNWLTLEKLYGCSIAAVATYTITGSHNCRLLGGKSAAGHYGLECALAGGHNEIQMDWLISSRECLRLSGSAGSEQEMTITVGKIWSYLQASIGVNSVHNGPVIGPDVRVTEIRGCNQGFLYTFPGKTTLRGTTFGNNTTDIAQSSATPVGLLEFDNVVANFITATTVQPLVRSWNHQQSAGAVYLNFHGRGKVETATDQRHTASDVSWKFFPLSTSQTSVNWPLRIPVARVAVNAGALCTAKIWLYRSNSSVGGRIFLKGGQIAGVASDVSQDITQTSTWEERTITFTPTVAGVVEIEVHAWDNTNTNQNLWADDFSFTQA